MPALLAKRRGGAEALGIGETREPEPKAWHLGFEGKGARRRARVQYFYACNCYGHV